MYYPVFIARRLILGIILIVITIPMVQWSIYFALQVICLGLSIVLRSFERKSDNINFIIVEISLTIITLMVLLLPQNEDENFNPRNHERIGNVLAGKK